MKDKIKNRHFYILNTDRNKKTTAKSKLPASVKRQRHNDYEPTLDTNNYSNDT